MIMEVTIRLDDRDLEMARNLTGIQDVGQLMPFVLKRFSQLEAGVQLARMGGSMPDFEVPPRRRPSDATESD